MLQTCHDKGQAFTESAGATTQPHHHAWESRICQVQCKCSSAMCDLPSRTGGSASMPLVAAPSPEQNHQICMPHLTRSVCRIPNVGVVNLRVLAA
jgi:hypothetical protein